MKNYKKLGRVLTGFALTAFGTVAGMLPARAQNTNFFCAMMNEYPTTVLLIGSREPIPIIRWVNGLGNFSPLDRCQAVSGRLREFHRLGGVNYLVASRVNGSNVICLSQNKYGPCDRNLPYQGVLFTLHPNVDPDRALNEMLDITLAASAGAAANPSFQTDEPYYIDLGGVLNSIEEEKKSATPN